jgi:hypothetical protein
MSEPAVLSGAEPFSSVGTTGVGELVVRVTSRLVT